MSWLALVPELAIVYVHFLRQRYYRSQFSRDAIVNLSTRVEQIVRSYNMGEGSDVGPALGQGCVGTKWSSSVKRLDLRSRMYCHDLECSFILKFELVS